MNLKRFFMVGFGLVLFPVFVYSGSKADAEEKVPVIRVSLQLPIEHSLGKNWQAFGKIVEERSDGQLKVEIFPSAELYKDEEVPMAVGSGSVEAGSTFLGRFSGTVPAVDVVSLPFLFKDEIHLRDSIKAGSKLRGILDQAILKKNGTRVLWWQAYGRNIYLSNGEAVKMPDDMRSKTVRTYGRIQDWTVEALGGSPMLISGTKQYAAYEEAKVDVGMTGVSAVKARELYNVMEYLTLSFDSVIEFVAVMNNDFFESLALNHQKIIEEAAMEVEEELRNSIYDLEMQIVDEMRSKMTVIKLSDGERQEWLDSLSRVGERFVEATGSMGRELIESVR